MTIPWTPQEDEAFNELGAGSGSDREARNGADAPARNEDAQVAAPSQPQDLPHRRTDAPAVDLTHVAATHPSPGRAVSLARPGKSAEMSPAGAQAERGPGSRKGSGPVRFLTLEMSPVAFTLGIWSLYALMALTAWLAVR